MAGLFRNSAFGTFLMAFLVSILSGWSTPVRHTETSPYQSPEPRTTTLPIDEYELLSLGNIQDRWTTTASGRQCCEHRCRSCRAARRRVSGTRNICAHQAPSWSAGGAVGDSCAGGTLRCSLDLHSVGPASLEQCHVPVLAGGPCDSEYKVCRAGLYCGEHSQCVQATGGTYVG